MDKRALPFFVLAITIVLSACVGGGGKEGAVSLTQGVVINSFSFNPTAITSGETGTFALNIENKGSVKATVNAYLYNMNYSGWSSDLTSANPNIISDIALMPPDPDKNIPGDTYVWTKDVTAPSIATGIKVPFNPRVRVCYKYNTTATTSFLVMSSDQWRIEQQQAKTTQTAITTQNSGAPVHFGITTRQPLIWYPTTGTTPTMRVVVEATNVDPSAGVPYFKSGSSCMLLPSTERNIVNVTVELIGIKKQSGTITLIGGKSGTKTFDFDAPNVTRQEVTAILTSDYGYFVEAEAPITVQKFE